MKTIYLKFVDFWHEFNMTNNIFLDCLKKHYNVILSDNPDYIIYSVFGHEYLKYDCVRIFYTSENIRPDFNLCDYAIAFDWMIFEDRYIRLPVYMLYEADLEKAMAKHRISLEDLSKKHRFCNFVYSNVNAHSARTDFLELMNAYKKVDSGGGYLNNLGYRVTDKLKFQENYKFSIAFENSSTSGYTTEKIIQAFAAKTVPIYWGNPVINREFSTKSFINCHEYNCFADVIKKIIEIDTNDDIYADMLKTPIYQNINSTDILSLSSLRNFLEGIFNQETDRAFRRAKSLHEVCYEKLRYFVLNSRRFL
ncbi:glycosyltransferase family 10 domain-containing protein [Sporomusa aerivorans]|uniref:glycosyltransferase family 10 domain-containing protein n=1 Tax=Sporomusa aerivorans TaxID=204936 RepID=UPI00352A333D